MKGITYKNVLSIALGLTALGFGCSDEVDLSATDGGNLKVAASIDGFGGVTTESGSLAAAADNSYDRSTFISGDKIKITKTYKSRNEISEYTLSSGTWTPPTGKDLTLQAGATFQAEYPTNYTGIESSQSTSANYLKSNLLRTATASSSPVNENVNFTFKHVNTKLTLIFKPSDTSLPLSGNLSFQVQAEGLLTGGSSKEIVTLYRPDNNVYTWHGIVYPKGAATAISVSVTYKNVTYHTTLSGCGLAAGSQYEYTLTIRNNILVPVGSAIKEWTPQQTHTGTLS